MNESKIHLVKNKIEEQRRNWVKYLRRMTDERTPKQFPQNKPE
jgi:hypothetical protein